MSIAATNSAGPPTGPSADRSREARALSLGASIAFAGVFAPLAVLLAYLPVWFGHVTFTPAQIGLLLGVPLAVRMLTTPLLLALGDRAGDRSRQVVAFSLLAFAASLGLFAGTGFALAMAVSVVVSVATAVAIPLVDAIALSGVRRHALDYGRMRLWGSLAFVAVTLLAGVAVDGFGAGAVPWLLAATLAAMALSGLALPSARTGRPGTTTAGPPWHDRPLVIGCVAAGLVSASHAAFYGFASIHWLSLGFSGTSVGVLWTIGVAAEVALFALAPRLLPCATPTGLLIAGCAAGVLRWAAFTVDGGVWWYALNSVLHGATFGAAHLGLQRLIAARVADARQGAAQGLAHAVSGPAMAGATLASGWLYGRFGVDAFLVMAALCALALVLALLVHPHKAGEGGETNEPE